MEDDGYNDNIPLPKKGDLQKHVFAWLDSITTGREFGPREGQKYVRMTSGGMLRPQDGSITRYIRKYRERGLGNIVNSSRSKSLYVKKEKDDGK
ncbi:MAG: hypothetical protein AB7D24_12585 [Sphaerochaeta sp.]|uniref:hypothetical protein n=1 Tax=Sphaerochaeta sp. TaxID=1972642 RepID=UPI003D09884C